MFSYGWTVILSHPVVPFCKAWQTKLPKFDLISVLFFFFFLLIWDCHTTQTSAGTTMRRRTVQTMVSKLCIEDSRSFLRLRWETWKQSWRRNCTWRAKAVWEPSGAERAQSGHRSSVLQRAAVSVGSKAGTEGAGAVIWITYREKIH